MTETKIETISAWVTNIASHAERARTGDRYEYTWNGLDAQGRAVAPGVYWARIAKGEVGEGTRIVRVR